MLNPYVSNAFPRISQFCSTHFSSSTGQCTCVHWAVNTCTLGSVRTYTAQWTTESPREKIGKLAKSNWDAWETNSPEFVECTHEGCYQRTRESSFPRHPDYMPQAEGWFWPSMISSEASGRLGKKSMPVNSSNWLTLMAFFLISLRGACFL